MAWSAPPAYAAIAGEDRAPAGTAHRAMLTITVSRDGRRGAPVVLPDRGQHRRMSRFRQGLRSGGQLANGRAGQG